MLPKAPQSRAERGPDSLSLIIFFFRINLLLHIQYRKHDDTRKQRNRNDL